MLVLAHGCERIDSLFSLLIFLLVCALIAIFLSGCNTESTIDGVNRHPVTTLP